MTEPFPCSAHDLETQQALKRVLPLIMLNRAVDPFAFQNGPPAAAAPRPGGPGAVMGGGMGMGGQMGGLGAKPAAGLGAPPATASASANKGLSLEDSLMANLAGLSMAPSSKVRTIPWTCRGRDGACHVAPVVRFALQCGLQLNMVRSFCPVFVQPGQPQAGSQPKLGGW